jgi:hypothetical protein
MVLFGALNLLVMVGLAAALVGGLHLAGNIMRRRSMVNLDLQVSGFGVSGGDFAALHAALFVAVSEFDLCRVDSGKAIGDHDGV